MPGAQTAGRWDFSTFLCRFRGLYEIYWNIIQYMKHHETSWNMMEHDGTIRMAWHLGTWALGLVWLGSSYGGNMWKPSLWLKSVKSVDQVFMTASGRRCENAQGTTKKITATIPQILQILKPRSTAIVRNKRQLHQSKSSCRCAISNLFCEMCAWYIRQLHFDQTMQRLLFWSKWTPG